MKTEKLVQEKSKENMISTKNSSFGSNQPDKDRFSRDRSFDEKDQIFLYNQVYQSIKECIINDDYQGFLSNLKFLKIRKLQLRDCIVDIQSGDTLLHLACKYNSVEFVLWILSNMYLYPDIQSKCPCKVSEMRRNSENKLPHQCTENLLIREILSEFNKNECKSAFGELDQLYDTNIENMKVLYQGVGGMILLLKHLQSGKMHVVKQLRSQVTEKYEMNLQECLNAFMMTKYIKDYVQNNHFVKIYDCFIEKSNQKNFTTSYSLGSSNQFMYFCYISMEYVNGCSVQKEIDTQKAEKKVEKKNLFSSNASFIHMMIHTLDALNQMHQNNTIHCDIKPDNILIQKVSCHHGVPSISPSTTFYDTQEPSDTISMSLLENELYASTVLNPSKKETQGKDIVYKLSDFGSTIYLFEDKNNKNVNGTDLFMSPEVYHAKDFTEVECDQSIDIFSLGASYVNIALRNDSSNLINISEMMANTMWINDSTGYVNEKDNLDGEEKILNFLKELMTSANVSEDIISVILKMIRFRPKDRIAAHEALNEIMMCIDKSKKLREEIQEYLEGNIELIYVQKKNREEEEENRYIQYYSMS